MDGFTPQLPRSSKLDVYFEDQLCADGHWPRVLRISYVRLSLLVYFEDQLSADCHWWRILRIIYRVGGKNLPQSGLGGKNLPQAQMMYETFCGGGFYRPFHVLP